MKVKVTKTVVNKDVLDDAIEAFEFNTIHKDQITYLIMNTETATIVNEELGKKYFHQVVSGPLGMYRGCKVLIDESLEFGEVDVR